MPRVRKPKVKKPVVKKPVVEKTINQNILDYDPLIEELNKIHKNKYSEISAIIPHFENKLKILRIFNTELLTNSKLLVKINADYSYETMKYKSFFASLPQDALEKTQKLVLGEKYKYVGAGTDVAQRIAEDVEPYNLIDRFARTHDIEYSMIGTLPDAEKTKLMYQIDQELIDSTNDVAHNDHSYKPLAFLVEKALKANKAFGYYKPETDKLDKKHLINMVSMASQFINDLEKNNILQDRVSEINKIVLNNDKVIDYGEKGLDFKYTINGKDLFYEKEKEITFSDLRHNLNEIERYATTHNVLDEDARYVFSKRETERLMHETNSEILNDLVKGVNDIQTPKKELSPFLAEIRTITKEFEKINSFDSEYWSDYPKEYSEKIKDFTDKLIEIIKKNNINVINLDKSLSEPLDRLVVHKLGKHANEIINLESNYKKEMPGPLPKPPSDEEIKLEDFKKVLYNAGLSDIEKFDELHAISFSKNFIEKLDSDSFKKYKDAILKTSKVHRKQTRFKDILDAYGANKPENERLKEIKDFVSYGVDDSIKGAAKDILEKADKINEKPGEEPKLEKPGEEEKNYDTPELANIKEILLDKKNPEIGLERINEIKRKSAIAIPGDVAAEIELLERTVGKKTPKITFGKIDPKPTTKSKIDKKLKGLHVDIGEARTAIEKDIKLILDDNVTDDSIRLKEIIKRYNRYELESLNTSYKNKIAKLYENTGGVYQGHLTDEQKRTLDEIEHIYNDYHQYQVNEIGEERSKAEVRYGRKQPSNVKYEAIPIDAQSELSKKIDPFLVKTDEEKKIDEYKKAAGIPLGEVPTIVSSGASAADKISVSTQRGVYLPNKPITGARNLSLYQIKGGADDVKMTIKEQRDTTEFYKDFVLVMPGYGNGNQEGYLGKTQAPDNCLLETIEKNQQMRFSGKLYQPAEINPYIFPITSDTRRKYAASMFQDAGQKQVMYSKEENRNGEKPLGPLQMNNTPFSVYSNATENRYSKNTRLFYPDIILSDNERLVRL